MSRSSTWSTRPTPCAPARSFSRSTIPTGPSARRRGPPGTPPSKLTVTSAGSGAVGRVDRPLVDIVGRPGPRVLEDAGLDGAAPDVVVDRVGRLLRDRDLDPAGDRVLDLLLARQAHADPHRGDHLESRVEGVDGDVEADLVVALARAAVGDRVGAFLLGDLDQELGDERPGERRGEGVDALVQRVRLEGRAAVVGDEVLARVHDVGAAGAGASRRASRHLPSATHHRRRP